jgi:hypothetical protein
MKHTNPYNLFFLCGSIIVLTLGLLSAFMPGIAYVTVQSYFMDTQNPYGLPTVNYLPIVFSLHMYTIKFLICAIGGVIGILTLSLKKNTFTVGFIATVFASVGLLLPGFGDTRITFPEMSLFDVPWIGSLLVLIGTILMFSGLVAQKHRVSLLTFLSVPILLAAYSIPPIFILLDYLPWAYFGSAYSIASLLIWSLMVVGCTLMLLTILKCSLCASNIPNEHAAS